MRIAVSPSPTKDDLCLMIDEKRILIEIIREKIYYHADMTSYMYLYCIEGTVSRGVRSLVVSSVKVQSRPLIDQLECFKICSQISRIYLMYSLYPAALCRERFDSPLQHAAEKHDSPLRCSSKI
jgi:hypothetical protein